MDNFKKCLRCDKNFIIEEFNEHDCNPDFSGVIELGIHYWYKGKKDQNGDSVVIGKGLDGNLYRLVKCPHNPPHVNREPRVYHKSTENLQREDSTDDFTEPVTRHKN